MKDFFKDKKNIFLAVVSALIAGALYYAYTGVWEPFANTEATLVLDISTSKQELDKINVSKKRRDRLKDDLANAEKEFIRLREMFPEEEKVTNRLQDLYSVVRSSGVQISKFEPGSRSEKEYYVENSYNLSINSGYHMLGYLFADIANFKYPTAITELKLNRYAGIEKEMEKADKHGWTPVTLTVTFKLTTYTSRKGQ